MGERASEDRQLPLTKYLGVAALSAVVGFAAVYVTLGRPDNAGKPDTVRTAAGTPAAPDPSTADKPSSAEAGSGMVAFVKKATPEPMPEFAFVGPQGQALKLADFKGRVVLLNLWATWCAPCRKELPELLARLPAMEAHANVVIATVETDAKVLAKYRKDTGVTLKSYLAPKGGLASKIDFGRSVPRTYLLDEHGRVISVYAGSYEWTDPDKFARILGRLGS